MLCLQAQAQSNAAVPAPVDALSTTNSTALNPGLWGSETNGFRLSLTTEKSRYNEGEPIYVELSLKNVTNAAKEIHVTGPGDIIDFRFSILDESGKQAPLTADAEKRKRQPRVDSEFTLTLDAGEEFRTRYCISTRWQMTAPGKYRILATRLEDRENWQKLREQGVPLEQRLLYVQSNPIEIEVVP